MKILSSHRSLFTLIVAILLVLAGAVAIFYARGFKPDFKNGKIGRTGLIVATSTPTGARIYLDDRLTSATNTNIDYLEPRKYKVKIQKDGYTTWEKEVEIKADLATEIMALLFPLAPEIKPLTTTGATGPALSLDGTKIAYGTPGERGGIYALTMSDTPIPFRQDSRLLAKNSAIFDYSHANFIWDPNSKQIIAQIMDTNGKIIANLLLDSQMSEQNPKDITGALTATLAGWQDQINTKAQTQATTAPAEVKSATGSAATSSQLTVNTFTKLSASSSQKISNASPQPISGQKTVNSELSTTNPINYYPTGLIYSADEEKVLYLNRENKYKIYDIKKKLEFTMPDFPDLISVAWYPDSNHLLVVQKDSISIIEADGTNKITVYSGKFADVAFIHPSGTRLIILTHLAQTDGSPANLYSLNLK